MTYDTIGAISCEENLDLEANYYELAGKVPAFNQAPGAESQRDSQRVQADAPQCLLDAHRADLRKSGLSDETIEKSGIYSATADQTAAILGFSPGAGMAIPYPGAVPAFTRIKPDKPFGKNDAKYLSPKKEIYDGGNRLYIPPILHHLVLTDPCIPLIITEGEKKALAACQNGFPAVALSGVSCWVTKGEDDVSRPLADFDKIIWTNRRVYIVFDSDIMTKELVREEAKKLFTHLQKRGAIVRVPVLPPPSNEETTQHKLGGKFGLDDYLLARGVEEFAEFVKKSRPPFPERPDGKKSLPINMVGDWVLKCLDLHAADGRLWVYQNGAYRPVGESSVEELALACMSNDLSWSKSRSEGVVHYIATKLRILRKAGDSSTGSTHVNVLNGRVNLATGELEPHTSGVFDPVQIPVRYDPRETLPATEKFMREVLEDDDKIALAEELIGYCLTRDTRYQKAFILTGSGANGKSTFLDMVVALLGSQNVSSIALHELLENRFRLAELHGKLANVAADLDQRSLGSTGLFKAITAGDPVTAEEKHRKPFSFRPYAKLLFSCNTLPFSPDHSTGFLRRPVIIPFNKSFTAGSADPNLLAKLTTPKELSGLLNLGLRGLRRLEQNGYFTEPKASTEAMDEYKLNINPVERFLEDVCDLSNPEASIPKHVLYEAYRTWCGLSGIDKIANDAKFAQELRQSIPERSEIRKWTNHGKTRIREWKGVSLLPGDEFMLTA